MGDGSTRARAARTGAVLAACAVATACSLSGLGDAGRDDAVEPSLPTVVNAPGAWSSDEEPRGPLAAMGLAFRYEPRGIWDEMESLGFFAVSALDGRSTWLPPLASYDLNRPASDAWSVSPDGRHVAWGRNAAIFGPGKGWIDGYAVMDTTTGEVRELKDPASPSGFLRHTGDGIAFSADSRYLLTSYALPGTRTRSPRSDQLVAWDLESGSPVVLEEPGDLWSPNLGSASSGVVWSRGRRVLRVDPATGARTTVKLPEPVLAASWGPGGSAFAYISQTPKSQARNRLHVGSSVDGAADRVVEMPTDAPLGQLLGWQDESHVVVGHYRSWVHVVDVATGDAQRIDMTGSGQQFNAPLLANALWREPLRTPVAPTGTTDPRRPWRWGVAALLVAGAVAFLVRRRRP